MIRFESGVKGVLYKWVANRSIWEHQFNRFEAENDLNRFELRGPGSIGVPTLTSHVGRYYIVANRHDTKTFVKKCDFISAFGWGMVGMTREHVWLAEGQSFV